MLSCVHVFSHVLTCAFRTRGIGGTAPTELDALLVESAGRTTALGSKSSAAAGTSDAGYNTSSTHTKAAAVSDDSAKETSSGATVSTSASGRDGDRDRDQQGQEAARRLSRLKRLLENQEMSAVDFNENVPLVPVHGRVGAAAVPATATSLSSHQAEVEHFSFPEERSKRNRVSRTIQMHIEGC